MIGYFVGTYGTQLLGAVLCALFGAAGYGLKRLAQTWLDDDAKRSVARLAAQFVEQVFRELHGADKLQKALETARDLLAKKGVAFDPEEMRVLIEAAVGELNGAFWRG